MNYENHAIIYDIGCDHGMLGSSFIDEPLVSSIYLIDPSSDVVKKLKDSYITIGNLKIHIEHKRGQEVILRPEKKLIFIAGMGGKEIGSILQSLVAQLTPEDKVVISPHRDILQLRESLSQSAFFLESESLILDEGRFYQIISLSLSGDEKVHPFGVDLWKSENGEGYRQHQILHFYAHQDTRSKAYVTYLKSLT